VHKNGIARGQPEGPHISREAAPCRRQLAAPA
jgi:hypothetical protein